MPAISPTWPFTPWTRAASLPRPPAALRGIDLSLQKRGPWRSPLGSNLQEPLHLAPLRVTGQLTIFLRERDSSSPLIRRWACLILRDQEAAEGPAAGEPAAVREAGELAGVAAEEVVGRVEEQAAVAVVRAEGLEGARA